ATYARREFELLVEGATDYAMLMLDPAGNILTWNNGAERLMGLHRDVAVGQPSAIFLAGPGAAAQIAAQLDQARRTGRFAGELWHKRVDFC
ncbi:MAG TPA: PAS domain-containing protein, partial [Novosphingobium sp.]|nr:PAS domain-containing protein [Novosphingobium sp.]